MSADSFTLCQFELKSSSPHVQTYMRRPLDHDNVSTGFLRMWTCFESEEHFDCYFFYFLDPAHERKVLTLHRWMSGHWWLVMAGRSVGADTHLFCGGKASLQTSKRRRDCTPTFTHQLTGRACLHTLASAHSCRRTLASEGVICLSGKSAVWS